MAAKGFTAKASACPPTVPAPPHCREASGPFCHPARAFDEKIPDLATITISFYTPCQSSAQYPGKSIGCLL